MAWRLQANSLMMDVMPCRFSPMRQTILLTWSLHDPSWPQTRRFSRWVVVSSLKYLDFLYVFEDSFVWATFFFLFGKRECWANELVNDNVDSWVFSLQASMFYPLYALACQLSPETRSSGIETIESDNFRMNCFQTLTGKRNPWYGFFNTELWH